MFIGECESSLQVILELRHGRHQQQGECHLKMELCVSVIILDYSKPFGSQNVHYIEIILNLYKQLGDRKNKIDIHVSNNLPSRIIML